MNSDEELQSFSWRPEADESVLRAMAETMNHVFGRDLYAHVEGGELIIHIGRKTVWIGQDGSLHGEASSGL